MENDVWNPGVSTKVFEAATSSDAWPMSVFFFDINFCNLRTYPYKKVLPVTYLFITFFRQNTGCMLCTCTCTLGMHALYQQHTCRLHATCL